MNTSEKPQFRVKPYYFNSNIIEPLGVFVEPDGSFTLRGRQDTQTDEDWSRACYNHLDWLCGHHSHIDIWELYRDGVLVRRLTKHDYLTT